MKTVEQLIKLIDGTVAKFNESIPGFQKQMGRELDLLLKELEVDAQGKIKPSVGNLKLIGRIKAKLDGLFRNPAYIKQVSEYAKAFPLVAKLQNQYFTDLSKEFKPNALLDEIKKQSIQGAVESLTGAGINANVTRIVSDILTKNITTGANYTELMNTVRDRLLSNESGLGLLERYTKQITTDSLNQYSAQYTNAVTNDLGLKWYMYTGSLIKTSRVFCEACVKKKYIHESEIPDLIEGNFREFEDMDGTINKNTGLPEGMVAGTNAENFHVYRGGYNCGHQLIPVAESSVPDEVKRRLGIKVDV